jgi:hypothetical protein
MPPVSRALPLAAVSLFVACFADEPPLDLTAGPQSTGAMSTGTTVDPATSAATTVTSSTSSTTDPATDTAPDTTTTTTTDDGTTGTTDPVDTTTTTDATTGVTPGCQQLAYSTEFDELDNSWTALTPGWAVAGGFYTNMNVAPTSATWRPDDQYADAILTVRLEVPKQGRAGLVFRAGDMGTLQGYYVSVEPDDQDIGFGVINALDLDQMWSDPYDLEPGSLLTLTAVFVGPELTIEIDGQPFAEGLPISQIETGNIGLFTTQTAARFDSVRICTL